MRGWTRMSGQMRWDPDQLLKDEPARQVEAKRWENLNSWQKLKDSMEPSRGPAEKGGGASLQLTLLCCAVYRLSANTVNHHNNWIWKPCSECYRVLISVSCHPNSNLISLGLASGLSVWLPHQPWLRTHCSNIFIEQLKQPFWDNREELVSDLEIRDDLCI